jgi:hypothetical protein
VVSGGLLCVAAVALLALAMPGFRSYDAGVGHLGAGAGEPAEVAH